MKKVKTLKIKNNIANQVKIFEEVELLIAKVAIT